MSDDHVKNMFDPDANSYCPNNNPVLNAFGEDWWINYQWSKKTGTYAGEPFNSIFDPKIIEKVNDGVTLWIRQPDIQQGPNWRTSELVLTGAKGEKTAGMGTHLATVRADSGSFSKFDPNVVFGFFIFQYDKSAPPNIHREVDFIEFINNGGDNAQFMLQPFNWKGGDSVSGFRFPAPDCSVVTIVASWDKGGTLPVANFYCFLGDYSLDTLPAYSSAYQRWDGVDAGFGELIPGGAGFQRVHFNFYLMGGGAPPSGEQSVTVTRYEYRSNKSS
jgi:hypothetical protein